MAKTQRIELTPALRKKIDKAVRSVKGQAAVDAMIEQRLTYRENTDKKVGWDAYQRYILSDEHVVFVSLRTLHASRSEKPIDKRSPAYRRYLSKQARAVEKAAKLTDEQKRQGVKHMREGKSAEEAAEIITAAQSSSSKKITKKSAKAEAVKA